MRLRARLRTVGVPPVEDLVEVGGEDSAPGVLPVAGHHPVEELLRKAGLLDLARQRPLGVPDIEVSHQLLGNGRAALDDLALRDVLEQGSRDALVVERTMLPEACI